MKMSNSAILCADQSGELFTPVAESVLFAQTLKGQAIRLYEIMCFKSRQFQYLAASFEELAQDIKLSRRQVMRLMANLERAGLVTRETRPGQPNLYHVHKPALRSKRLNTTSGVKNVTPSVPQMSLLNVKNVVTKPETEPTILILHELKPECEKPGDDWILNQEPLSSSSETTTIAAMYREEGVMKLEAETIAAKKPNREYARTLIERSREDWVKDGPALIVYFGKRGELPTRRATPKPPQVEKVKDFKAAKAYLKSLEGELLYTPLEPEPTPIEKDLVALNDPRTRSLIRQLDREAYAWLHVAYRKADTLWVKFQSPKSLKSFNTTAWLPTLGLDGINHIQEI